MSKTNMRRFKLAAIVLVSGAFLALVWVLGWPRTATGRVSVQVTSIRPADTNIVEVSLTFSNGASRSLNIVDAADGHPWYHIQPHPQLQLTYGFGLAHIANSLKINLAPGATLTDNFRITNPPPQFRIKVPIRDCAAESTLYSAVVSSRLGKTLVGLGVIKSPDPEFHSTVPAASSAWVEAKLP